MNIESYGADSELIRVGPVFLRSDLTVSRISERGLSGHHNQTWSFIGIDFPVSERTDSGFLSEVACDVIYAGVSQGQCDF